MGEPDRTGIDSVLSANIFDSFYSNSNLDLALTVTDAKKIIDRFRTGLDRESKPNCSLCKLLHAMLDHAPCPEGKRYVASVLHAISREERTVLVVARTWLSNLFFQMLALASLRSPASSEQRLTIDETPVYIKRVDRTKQQSLWDQVRLMYIISSLLFILFVSARWLSVDTITGFVDANLDVPCFTAPRAHMKAARIMSLSLNSSDKAKTIHDLSATWDLLCNWTSIDFRDLISSDIDTPKNAIFMTRDSHSDLKKFLCYFDGDAFPELNKYMVRSVNSYTLLGMTVREVVCKFNAESSIAPPDPYLLAIHAAFAKVLHACGAGEHLDRVLQDMERLKVLSSDCRSDIGLFLSSRLAVPTF
ncbi:hypothetical protein EDD18DRAFT_1355723 [Armillaria luteobubalina]|uniref:HNH nuclease domain-containing protein n=1 Tax=Armillaria luteobubalina TaxID=153913 RepID=A0AA39Q309_9AGAR|nr:hypothetical protein EDD18DRAFT_1355723 [Armillaria luteobubalina]